METKKRPPTAPIPPSGMELMKKLQPNHPILLDFEEKNKIYKEKLSEFLNQNKSEEKPKEKQEEPLCKIDIDSLFKRFLVQFYHTNQKYFDPSKNDHEAEHLAILLVHFFARNHGNDYTKSHLINKKINQPNRDKGLLILGNFGCGKTSQIKAFYDLFRNAQQTAVKDIKGNEIQLLKYQLGFSFRTANDIVTDFENLQNGEEKTDFWKKVSSGLLCIDDLMTERIASNYGKVDIFKEILEKRYSNFAKTIISMNYTEFLNTEKTLQDLGERYGSRVYDRLFEMFNIVELKGKSLRI